MPLPNLDELLEKDPIKRPDAEPTEKQTQGRKKTSEIIEGLSELDAKEAAEKKKALLEMFFDENKEVEELLELVLKDDGMPVGSSSLKGVRQTLEDMLNIDQLVHLVKTMREQKTKNMTPEESQQNDDNGIAQLMTLLPMLQSKSENLDTSDPNLMMMLMMMMGNKSNNSGMNPMMLLPMLQFMNKQPAQQTDPRAITELYNEMKNVMAQQQKPQYDPMMLMLMKNLMENKNNNNNNNNNNNEIMMKMMEIQNNNQVQFTNMMMTVLGDKFERFAELIPQQSDPTDTLVKNLEILRNLTGDQRKKEKDELEYDLKKKELDLKAMERKDLLDRQERAEDRESAKSERIVETADKIMDKILGEGTQAIIGEVFKNRRKTKGSGIDMDDLGGYSMDDLDDL